MLGTGAGVSAFALGRWAPGTGDPAVGRAAWGALDRTLSDNQRERIFLPWNHRVAGLDYFVDHEAEEYGEYVQRQGTGLTLRETLVRQVRAAGRIGSGA